MEYGGDGNHPATVREVNALQECTGLRGVYFEDNAPPELCRFGGDEMSVTVY